MSYTTNSNLIRNGLTKNWKRQDFPQKKMYYGYKSIFVIKLYFWLRLFFTYHKINLIQFSIILLEDNVKSIAIVINRSFFKNRGRKRHWLFPSFSKLNYSAILILYSYFLLKLRSIKKNDRIRKSTYPRFWNRQIYNTIFHVNFLKQYLRFINKKKLLLYYNNNQFKRRIEINKLFIIKAINPRNFKTKFLNINKKWVLKSAIKSINKNKKIKIQLLQKKKFKKIFRIHQICAWLGHKLYSLFNSYFIVKIRFEKLSFGRLKEKEDALETITKQNFALLKFSNKIYNTKLILPKSIISNITQYSEFLWTNSIYKFLNSFKFKRLENILVAAVKFKNIQILADLLAFKLINQWNHKKIFLWVSTQLNYILLNNLGGNLKTYRIGLYGRINNVPRARAMFFSSKNYSKPNRGTFSNQIYYAESRATAPIGAFHIRVWFEYII